MTEPSRRGGARSQRPTRAPVPPRWARMIDCWKVAHTGSLAPTTLQTRATCLRNLARACPNTPPTKVTAATLQTYIDSRVWAPTTYRANVKAIRALFRWMAAEGIISGDPAYALPVTLSEQACDQMQERAQSASDERPVTGPEPLSVPPVWAEWIEGLRRFSLAGGRTQATVSTRANHLGTLSRWCDRLAPYEVEFGDRVDYLAERSHLRAETRRSIRGSIRAFYEWAVIDGRIVDNPAERLPRIRSTPPVPRPAPADAYADALDGADDRVTMMLRLSAELGMRRAEVACAHTRDLIEDEHKDWWLLCHGKGNKERMLPLPRSLAAEICAYAPGDRYLFPSIGGGHLPPRYVGALVRRRLPPGVSMHRLRHRFATKAYSVSRDLLTVQRLLGHSSPATTQRYIAADDGAMRHVVEQVQAVMLS